jgi:hypothetical protein
MRALLVTEPNAALNIALKMDQFSQFDDSDPFSSPPPPTPSGVIFAP